MRALLLLVLLLLAMPAQAQTYSREQAWANCSARAAQWDADAAAQNPPGKTGHWCKEYINSPTSGAVYLMSPPPGSGETGVYWGWAGTCAPPNVWDPNTNTCRDTRCDNAPPVVTHPSKEG